MPIKGTFLNSKVARRIFGLFLITALIPILIFAYFSFQQVNHITTENVLKNLKNDTKNYGLFLHERLTLIEHKLKFYRNLAPHSHSTTKKQLDDFEYIAIEKMPSGNTLNFNLLGITLTTSESNQLKSGRQLLHVQNDSNGQPAMFMLIPETSDNKVTIARLRLSQLWGDPDSFDASKVFCVFDALQQQTLFCSDTAFEKILTNNPFNRDTSQIDNYFISVWSLFLKLRYFYDHINIVMGVNKQQVLEPTKELKNLFILVSVLAVVIVALMSTIQIRRYLNPIEALMKGIKRISHNDFEQTVEVNTDDEFKQLGDSFNSMSHQIAHQFDFLTTLSEIDQLVLNNLNEQDIIATTITHVNKAVRSKMAHIVLVGNDLHTITLYQQDNNHIHGISQQSVEISEFEIEQLLTKETQSFILNDPLCPDYLTSLFQAEIANLIVVPVLSHGILKALLILGFDQHQIEDTVHERLRELGDRIAIAFEKSAWEKTLYQQAHFDPLTGLPNRLLLNDRLQQSINTAQQNNTVFSVLFLDLDQFKTINDSFGHTIGDNLLKTVANKLTNALNNNITISRLGGDEFIILLPNQVDNGERYADISNTAEQILHLLSEPFTLENQDVHISTSIVIASFPSDAKDAESLLTNADSAMYHAKSSGRNNFQFYASELTEKALEKLLLKSDLYNAFENNEFKIYYQTKVCSKTHTIVGAEALIRWLHPKKGLISPFFFIPIAEESGLITQLGEWIINQCCLQNKQWQDAGLPKIKVSVNLSPKQFHQQNLITVIQNALFNSGLEGQYLDLEIVEGTAMNDTNQTIKILNELKQFQLAISIDDYGTGYSSLSYIKQFPVDTLKIDKSFIDNICQDKGDLAIVRSTITLAHNLGLTVVAEGVEEADQLSILKELDCDEIQGYYFSKPIPAEEFEQLLKQSPLLMELNKNEIESTLELQTNLG